MNRYDSYKDSGVEWIGKIPSHWDRKKVKYLGNVNSGDGLESSLIEDEGDYPVYGGNGVMGYYHDFNQSTEVLSIGRVGEKCGNVHFVNEKVWINDNSLVFEPNKNVETLWYVFHSLTQRNLNHLRNKNTQPLITGTLVKNEYIPVPPSPEQQQIVSFIRKKTLLIDSLIEKTQRKIELLKEKRTSLINEVVTKGLNPNVEMKDSGVEWIGEIPNHWTRNKLNRISERIGDGLHSTPKYVDSSEYYFINGNNLVNGEIKIFDSTKCVSEEEFKKHFIQLNTKTLLLSINGTIGNLSFYNDEKVILGKSSCYINLKENINHHFIYYVLKSESISKYFTFELTGTTIFNLSLNSIRNTPIVVPPENEQHQIVEYLDEQTGLIDKTISIEEKRIELLKEYRQSLISEVVTGKRKVVE